jgi:CRISPR-associated endonuclease/helicase Cas3
MAGMPDYFRYWAKTNQNPASTAPCHLLPYHLLDVAAVAEAYWDAMPQALERFAARLQVEPETLRRLFVYSMALHDIGKFARSFQSLADLPGLGLVEPDSRYVYDPKHGALGLLYWYYAFSHIQENGGCGIQPEHPLTNRHRRGLELWFGPIFGHHGEPVDGAANASIEQNFTYADSDAAWRFMQDAADLLAPRWPLESLADRTWRRDVLTRASWELAGLAVLVDWLGSDQTVFGYRADHIPLAQYWHEYARPAAERTLARSGLCPRPVAQAFTGFQQSYGFEPTPLQRWAETVPISDQPQCFLLEDMTGAGKTEAALTLAQRLMAGGHGDGLYLGLPTMATSNAMYERIGQALGRMFATDRPPSLVLAHGARHINESFNQSILPTPPLDRAYSADDPGGLRQCSQWLADNRKKALLADVGVGTIDQALLSLLPRKHQSVRLFGLTGKILVVDEVHAYDSYTGDLLQQLLAAHAARGGSVIILSATIPERLRQGLVGAWRYARARELEPSCASEAFPLASAVDADKVDEAAIDVAAGAGRNIPIRFLEDSDTAIDTLIDAAREGRCGCWIRNTVDDAVAAYDQLASRLEATDRLQLFHARFAMGDRRRIEDQALATFGKSSDAADRSGAILIATQVVEQSLDLDFDVLISDLAPVDLLIQRAGRLQRHARDRQGNRLADGAPDERRDAALHVRAPAWAAEPDGAWVRRALPGTSYVYDTTCLWLTMRVLGDRGAIRLPSEARHLLESVYGPAVEVPEGLSEADGEALGERQMALSQARVNSLYFEQGYCQASATGQWEDDEEVGTRLADERTDQVVLVTEAQDGSLQPLFSDDANQWAMSTLQLRQSLANRVPPLEARFDSVAERLRSDRPGLKYARFWLVKQTPASGELRYDRVRGATKAS